MNSSSENSDEPPRAPGPFDEPAPADVSDQTAVSALTRRRVLLSGGAVAVGVGLAGCGDLTQQSFEATALELSTTNMDDLGLTQQSTRADTISREGIGDQVEVSITNQAAVFDRAAWLRGDADTEGE